MVLELACGFCISTKDEHDWCSVFVPTHALPRHASPIEPSPSSRRTPCRVTRPNLQVANRLAAFVHDIIAPAATCSTFEASSAARCAAAEALRMISLVIQEPPAPEAGRQGGPRISRRDIIRRCRELLEERRWEPVRITELTTAAGVSERTLETAFEEYFGLTPVHYLMVRRLHAVRRALRAAEPDAESVTDIIARHGEWEFGRFARRYRRLFGELPSATLGCRKGDRSMQHQCETDLAQQQLADH